MIGLIQRVARAEVVVDGAPVGRIGSGIVLLLAVQRGDVEATGDRLLDRVLSYRIFADAQQRMNLSLLDTRGELLVVSQFTLAADTQKGTRAGFSRAATPAEGERLYDYFVSRARIRAAPAGVGIATGRFGADMQVTLTNDGPVTFWLEVSPPADSQSAD